MVATQMDIEVERDGRRLVVTVDASDDIGGPEVVGMACVRIADDGRRVILGDEKRLEVELTEDEVEEANARWPDARLEAIEDARWGHL